MTPERWRLIEQLFDAAAALPPEQRAIWLEQACAGDAELLRDLGEMLTVDARGGVISAKIQAAAAEFAREGSAAKRAGPYRLTRELGRGGMGTVYLGERDDGEYDAQVAVKLIRAGMDTEFFLGRFKRERQALARLQHPNIARIFDSGTTA